MRRPVAVEDPMNFMESFVDLLSCGLGAALLLFLIFATMPRSGSDRVGSTESLGLAADRASLPAPSRTGISQLVLEIEAPEMFTLDGVSLEGVIRPDERCETSQALRAGRRVFQFHCLATDGRLADSCVELRLATPRSVEVTVSKLTSAGRSSGRLKVGGDSKPSVVSVLMEEANDFVVVDRSCR